MNIIYIMYKLKYKNKSTKYTNYFYALLNLHHNTDIVSDNFSVVLSQCTFNISGVKISSFKMSE